MASSTTKRVLLYRFDRQPLEGFASPQTYQHEQTVEIISLEGSLYTAPYPEVKAVCFLSEKAPEGLFGEGKFFERRPKIPGIWTRFTFRDGDQLDGVLPHSLLEWPEKGFLVIPPRAGPGRQLVFIPRTALVHTEVRGVIGKAAQPRVKKAGSAASSQIELFGRP